MPRPRRRLVSSTRRMIPKRVVRLMYKREPEINVAAQTEVEEQVDQFLADVIASFDLSPILFGDPLRARFVAVDLIREVRERARHEASLPDTLFTEEDVMNRWADIVDNQVRSLMVFRRLLSSRVAEKGNVRSDV